MIIGVPSEVKNNENRVGLTPNSVQSLVSLGHDVLIQNNAGANMPPTRPILMHNVVKNNFKTKFLLKTYYE